MKLDQKKIAVFKEKLLEEQRALEVELTNIGLYNEATKLWDSKPSDADNEADENDRADRAEEYEERTGKVKSLGGRWQDVKAALKKIDDGTYGVCEVSNEPIEMERLEANPAARTCIAHMNG